MTASKDRVKRRVHIPREGIGVLVLAFLLGLAAVNSGINLIYLLTATLLGVFLAGGILGRASVRGMRVRRSHASQVFAGEPLAVDVIVRNEKRLTGAYGLQVGEGPLRGRSRPGAAAVRDAPEHRSVLLVPPGGSAVARYWIVFAVRGRQVLDEIVVRTRFPFGLSEQQRTHPVRTEVTVFPPIRTFTPPARVPAPAGKVPQRRAFRAPEEDEFHGVREYRDGDNPRWIHWRTTARTGALMVKDLRDPKRDRVAVVLETRLPEGAGEEAAEDLERGIVLAASILHHEWRRGRSIGLVADAQERVHFDAERGRAHLYRILEALACLEPPVDGGGGRLAAFAERELRTGEQVYYLSLGGRAPIPSGWVRIDLAKGEDRPLLKEEADASPHRP